MMTQRKKQLLGVVVSDRMEKTIVVRVSRLVRHPNYPRVIRRAKKFKVHDPLSQAHVGDEVRIEETRPISKEKCWRLVEVLRRGVAHLEAKEEERKEELRAVGAIREKEKPHPQPAADSPVDDHGERTLRQAQGERGVEP